MIKTKFNIYNRLTASPSPVTNLSITIIKLNLVMRTKPAILNSNLEFKTLDAVYLLIKLMVYLWTLII